MSQLAVQRSSALAQQVSSLLDQSFDMEWTGHAYDAIQHLKETLVNKPTLLADLQDKIERFACKTGTTQMYLRILVTDKQPDLQNYDPSQFYIYDGMSGAAEDATTIIVQDTISGTKMTSTGIMDLDFEARTKAGSKRLLVVHFGTDKNHDLHTMDQLLTALPALLQTAGMKPAQIAEVLAAIKSGNLPPIILKALHTAVEIAQLKKLSVLTPEQITKLHALAKDFLAIIKTKTDLPVIFAKTLTVLAPVIKNTSLTAKNSLSIAFRAQNDNRPATTDIRTIIQSIRLLAKDRVNLSLEQRKELAKALRDLRAGLKSDTSRLLSGLVRIGQFVAKHIKTPVIAALGKTIALPLTKVNATYIRSAVQPLALSAHTKILNPVQRIMMSTGFSTFSPKQPGSTTHSAIFLKAPDASPVPSRPEGQPTVHLTSEEKSITSAVPSPANPIQSEKPPEIPLPSLDKNPPAPPPSADPTPQPDNPVPPPTPPAPPTPVDPAPQPDNPAPPPPPPPVEPVQPDNPAPPPNPPAPPTPLDPAPQPDNPTPPPPPPPAEPVQPDNPAPPHVPEKEKPAELPPPEKSIPDCCDPKKIADVFNKLSQLETKTITKEEKIILFGEDIAKKLSDKDALAWVKSKAEADSILKKAGGPVVDTGDIKFQDETARLIADIEKKSSPHEHVHTEFCEHALPKKLQEAKIQVEILKIDENVKISAQTMKFEM